MRKKIRVVIITLLLTFIVAVIHAQTIYYVDASKNDNTGAGTSWATAKKDLQNAIQIATNGDAIWVKAGTYLPTEDPAGNSNPADPRDKTFFLKDGVKVYGGFNGTETILSQRNILTNVTTLSGDIGIATDASDNSYHVVLSAFTTITPASTLDGFTVTGGNANVASYITVNTVAIYRNNGGGIYTRYGANTITNNIVSGNAASATGGGIYTVGGAAAFIGTSNNISNNNIIGNTAGSGGAIGMALCTNTLSNNSFNGNSASNGGGIYTNGGVYTLTGNSISNNTVTTNGGGALMNSSTNTFTNNSIISNSSSNGGGIYVNNGTITFTNNVMSSNSATTGGAIYAIFAVASFTNNTLSGNAATSNAGGLFTNTCINTMVVNNIFWGNNIAAVTNVPGADYYEAGTSGNTFTNNLLQLTSGNYTTSGAGSYDLGTAAAGNLFAVNPNFVNASDPDGADNINRTPDDGLRLLPGSPAINAGATSVVTPATDITGATRGVAPFELGAYEWFTCPGNSTLYVDASVGTSGDGNSWSTAYKSLDEALFAAQSCPVVTTINVAAGIYKPSKKPYINGIEMITADARDATFYLRDNLALYGGYPSGGGTRNITLNTTTLSGDIGITNDASDNCYHVVLAAFTNVTQTATVDGFTITGGNANSVSNLTLNSLAINRNNGAGIYSKYGINIIANNTISGNTATTSGGGVYNAGGPVGFLSTTCILTNNSISNNTAAAGGGVYSVLCTTSLLNNYFSNNNANTNSGGGITLNGGTAALSGNSFISNTAAINGGGINNGSTTSTFTNNSIIGNTSGSGSGIFISGGTHTFTNNVFSSNAATTSGGGINANGCFNVVFINNTISSNAAGTNGGGLFTNSCLNMQFKNNIFWSNKIATNATVQGADYNEGGTNGNTFTNNLLQLTSGNYSATGSGAYDLGTAAAGNLFATDPGFANETDPDGADNINRTADDGLRISCNSIGKDAGTTSMVETDILGNTRNGVIDLGAYEANGTAAVNVLPAAATVVSLTQPAAAVDYTSCDSEIAKVDGTSPYNVTGNTTVKVWIEAAQPATFVKRHYEITPVNNSGTATGRVTLFFTQAEFDVFNIANAVKLPVSSSDDQGKANLRIYKIAGTSNDGTGLPATYTGPSSIIDPGDADIIWNSTAGRWEVIFDVTGFSGFFAEAVLTSLPLHWLSVTGNLNSNKQAVINWQVEESSVSKYQVEKSRDGSNFSSLTDISSKGDGHNSYVYTEPMILQGITYYRIKQIDINGRMSYSTVIKLSATNSLFSIAAYPNPVKDMVTIKVPNNLLGSKALLTDLSGKQLQSLSINQLSFTIDMNRYLPGIYFLKLDGGLTQKIIKE